MLKEEHILFPWIRQIAGGPNGGAAADSGAAGPHPRSVGGPIAVMEAPRALALEACDRT